VEGVKKEGHASQRGVLTTIFNRESVIEDIFQRLETLKR